MAIQIITDSACDMDPQVYTTLGITVLPLRIIWDGKEYLDNVTMSHREFFTRLAASATVPTTSQITIYEYEQAFQNATANGDYVLCITLSSKLSGCYQNACIAAEGFPGKVFVVDSLHATLGEQLLVQYALRMKDQGMKIRDIVRNLNEKKSEIHLFALVDTLEYLKKGGRLSSAAAFAGALLSIKPVITLTDGEVVVVSKARGTKASLKKIAELALSKGGIDFSMPFFFGYTGLDSSTMEKLIETYPEITGGRTVQELPTGTIGCAIGTHVGPGAAGLVFFGKS